VALGKSRGFRPLRRATADRGGSDKPFEKGLSQNFKQINSPTNQNLKTSLKCGRGIYFKISIKIIDKSE